VSPVFRGFMPRPH